MTNSLNGTNNASVRIENLKKLTRILYMSKDGYTKQDLANELKLSLPTINGLIQQLEDSGLLARHTSAVSSGGRIPSLIRFKYDTKFVIGVEIYHQSNEILLMDMECNILDSEINEIKFDNTSEYLKILSKRVQLLLEKNNIMRKDFLGVGIAVPAPVRFSDKLLELAPTVGLNNYYYDYLETIFGCPVYVENEANAAGFAEVHKRSDIQNAAYLSVKSKGVGGAIIIGGELFYGSHCRAAEFGHINLFPGGNLCVCGKTGCMETYCSTRVLSAHANGDLDLFFSMKNHDRHLERVWEVYLKHLSIGISSIFITLDMPVILGGDLGHYIKLDFQRLQEMVEKQIPYENDSPVLLMAHVDKYAAAIGCSLVIVLKHLNII